MSSDTIEISEKLCALGAERGIRLFIVGGAVRDLMRGVNFDDRDIDIVVEGNAIQFAEAALPLIGGTLKTFPDFFTAKILGPTAYPMLPEIDFASTRVERYEKPGKLPAVTIATIAEDLSRRDFSINAMALPLEQFGSVLKNARSTADLKSVVLDPFHGTEDLEKKSIRVLHQRSFLDDPTRMYRAARYAARLEGLLAPDTLTLAQEALKGAALNTISDFRIATEMRKLLAEKNAQKAFTIIRQIGLFQESRFVPVAQYSHLETFVERLLATENSADILLRSFLQLLSILAATEQEAIQKLLSFGLNKKKCLEIIAEGIAAKSGENSSQFSNLELINQIIRGD